MRWREEVANGQRWWALWLDQCSLSGLHAFARETRIATRFHEDGEMFRERLVELAKAGQFSDFWPFDSERPERL